MASREAPTVLQVAATEIADRPDWEKFARYCSLRSQGLRSEAFGALHDFLETVRGWPPEARLTFARWIIGHWSGTSVDAALAPQPLTQQILTPTVRLWCEQEPDNAQAWFAKAILRCDRPADDLERALALDPSH